MKSGSRGQAGRLSQHQSLYIALETFQVVVRPLDGSGQAFCCVPQRVLGEHDHTGSETKESMDTEALLEQNSHYTFSWKESSSSALKPA